MPGHPAIAATLAHHRIEFARETIDTGRVSMRTLMASVDTDDQLPLARSFVAEAIASFWKVLKEEERVSWPLYELPETAKLIDLPLPARELARRIGTTAAWMDAIDAGHRLGIVYTTLLPAHVRTKFGAFYTPPVLCERLLDMATEEGVDWSTCKVLDPACGGGAFLSPLALRMLGSIESGTPATKLSKITSRLSGFELDPFAAWMSQVFLEVALDEICRAAHTRLPPIVRICDSLEQVPDGSGFDLVVGNPPYGRLTLPPRLRKRYERSLFGHANLYGVFTDLALRLARPGGVIAYVTPTSFLAGEYFKFLRGLLGREAPPAGMDFITERRGVFEDVQQETLLATYRPGGNPRACKVHFISSSKEGRIKTSATGSFQLPNDPRDPWLIPRLKRHRDLVRQMNRMPHRLADYGYTVSTGPLVWNRHKPLLRDEPGKGRFPLIWAEAVRSDGSFEFRSERKNHRPYFEPGPKEQWVVAHEPCVLLQRTTAKEQSRRLIAAELPREFIERHGAVVIENHLNMIRANGGAPKVAPAVLAALFNAEVVDQAFRCINGSVAVSAYELKALPLPPPKMMAEIERLVRDGAEAQTINKVLETSYRGHEA